MRKVNNVSPVWRQYHGSTFLSNRINAVPKKASSFGVHSSGWFILNIVRTSNRCVFNALLQETQSVDFQLKQWLSTACACCLHCSRPQSCPHTEPSPGDEFPDQPARVRNAWLGCVLHFVTLATKCSGTPRSLAYKTKCSRPVSNGQMASNWGQ